MTDSVQLDDPPGRRLPWRERLQRDMRERRRFAPRDALVGVVVSVLLIAVLQVGTTWRDTRARDDAAPPGATAQAAEPEAEPAEPRFSAAMVGDIMFGRHVERVADRLGHDALLERVAPYLEADYVSGNLEQVISERDDLPEADKIIHLASDGAGLGVLADSGFDVLTLANNHAMDHGIPGLSDTIDAIDRAGMGYVGAGLDLEEAMRVHLTEHDGLTVATLSFTDVFVEGFVARAFQGGVLDAEPDRFAPLIIEARQEADLVIAQFHWGEEYDFGPNSRQRELAELAAEAGADIIVGHHPHVLMPAERIGDTLVLYSLGNFVFDQGWSRTRESAIARYELAEDGTARIELRPVYIREATPRPVEGALGAYRRARIFRQLRGSGLEWRREGDVLVTEIDHRHVLEGRQGD